MTGPASQNGTQIRVIAHELPLRVLVTNAKGGCGKTTIATNLASAFAKRGDVTALVDYDPQSSAIEWLRARTDSLPGIAGVDAVHDSNSFGLRSWEIRIPSDTRSVVIDSPAGVHGNELAERIRKSDVILIPVLPSAIDIRAATKFISEVLLSPIYRQNPRPVAVIANRSKKTTLTYQKLERFLRSLRIPFVTSVRDVQQYVKSAEQGCGILDQQPVAFADQRSWNELLNWLDQQREALQLANKPQPSEGKLPASAAETAKE